jgi:N6-L-threonylcarbamoyladenine synthase
MIVLGIETSCDETAASILRGEDENVEILSNVVSSQIEIHKQYGGVIPEVAAREHVFNILPVVDKALSRAGIKKEDASKKIGAIAVAVGPGLITSLIIGVETAKTLSYVWGVPVIGVNHIEGHIYANFIGERKIKFPAVVLTVSGGHTMLVLMEKHGSFKTIGETRDDAAGEAFDKAAKLLDIGYPGGPAIAAWASKYKEEKNTEKIRLPRPMINSLDFAFSFSGLKTALRYQLEKDKDWKKKVPEYCHEFQQAVIDTLVTKTLKAAKKFEVKTVMLSGGVSANIELRARLERDVLAEGLDFVTPELKYTTDNAAMVACAGYFKATRKEFTQWQDLKVDCNLEL